MNNLFYRTILEDPQFCVKSVNENFKGGLSIADSRQNGTWDWEDLQLLSPLLSPTILMVEWGWVYDDSQQHSYITL